MFAYTGLKPEQMAQLANEVRPMTCLPWDAVTATWTEEFKLLTTIF